MVKKYYIASGEQLAQLGTVHEDRDLAAKDFESQAKTGTFADALHLLEVRFIGNASRTVSVKKAQRRKRAPRAVAPSL